jgi:hypothetical protein
MPHVDKVARECARRDQHNVDPDVLTASRVFVSKQIGSSSDPFQPVMIDGQVKFGPGSTRFHFDKRHHAPPFGNQIDFTDMRAHALRNDPPAVQA